MKTKVNNIKNDLNTKALHFIKELITFEYEYEFDKYWSVIFNNGKSTWFYLNVTEYEKKYYISNLINGESVRLDTVKKKVEQSESVFQDSFSDIVNVSNWEVTFDLAIKWLKQTEKDWLKTNKIVVEQFPYKYRKGIVPSSFIANYFPTYVPLQKQVGIRNCKTMLRIIESGYFKNQYNNYTSKLTANVFFEYCKLAYNAVGLNSNNKTGKELYQDYADGRHDGLLNIKLESEKEFADWIDGKHPKKEIGGHPWEIIRGGNSSNIQLNVRRPFASDKNEFIIEVYATGESRLAESIKIFLEIHKANLSISIANPDFIREQLCLKDNYGIIPEFDSLHRANQKFDTEDKVSNVLYFNDVKKHQSKLLPFINWEPLPILIKKKL